jgi:hypothetical protein
MGAKLAPSRVSGGKVVAQLKLAARKGDRAALILAVDQMRTLAFSPRYWEKYLRLLANPLARLVDLLVIKQGDKIARQKGWVKPKRRRPSRPGKGKAPKGASDGKPGKSPPPDLQPSLFPDLP